MFDNGWVHMDFLRDHTEAPFLIKEDGKFFKMSDLGVEPTEGPVNPLTGKPTVIDPCIVWDEETGTHVPYAKAVKPKMENVPAIKGVAVRTEFEVLREYIMGWTVERASEVCGVPVEQIVELAKIYACDGPVTTDMKFGLNHYNNGLYSTGCVCCVLLLSGNFGVQGAGVWTGEPNFGTGNNAACSKMPSSKGEPVKGAGININWSYFYDIVHTGKRLGKDFPIKAFYASCTNIVSNQTEQNETLKLMKELEFIVIQDITMNDTACMPTSCCPPATGSKTRICAYATTATPTCCGTKKPSSRCTRASPTLKSTRCWAPPWAMATTSTSTTTTTLTCGFLPPTASKTASI